VIETDQQRRWWFATHPEFSSSHKEERSRHFGGGDDSESDNPSPEFVDAWVDGALKQERDDFFIELFRDIKSQYGTESMPRSLPGGQSGNDLRPLQPSDLLSAYLDNYHQYGNRPASTDPNKEAAIKSLMEAGWPREKAEERWRVFKLSDDIARGVAEAVAAARASLTGKYRDAISALEAWVTGKRSPRLPPKGTPERAKIEADRRRGRDAKKREEVADIEAGGKGSGVWSEKELETIRRTGEFPPGTEWHHDPTVANRPDLAADPKVVHPVPGGRKAHFDLHGKDWRNPRE